MNKNTKIVIIAATIVVILLTASLISVIANYTSNLDAKNDAIASKDSTISQLSSQLIMQNNQLKEANDTINTLTSQLTSQALQTANLTSQVSSLSSQMTTLQSQSSTDKSTITNLQAQVTTATTQINTLNSNITLLQNQVNDLIDIINIDKSQLPTLVFHVCEKGENNNWGHLPNATDTYSQILALDNNTYNVLLLPEYQGNVNWTQELAWLSSNFGGPQGIPIMLDVFGGGDSASPIPMLSVNDISAAMAVCNIQYLRIAEVVSWHIEHQQPLPTTYITDLLAFAQTHNLKVFWTEWKAETFTKVQTCIIGYENITTVSFSTNSQDLQPTDGYQYLKGMFTQWGASVQAWYWETHYNASLMDMPATLLLEHALAAKTLGAEVIQFEPYWYFFNNGQATDNLKLLENNLI